MATSAKRAAMLLQDVWHATPTGENGWRINGSPGLGDWFQLIAPDGTKFLVHVEVDTRATSSTAEAGQHDVE